MESVPLILADLDIDRSGRDKQGSARTQKSPGAILAMAGGDQHLAEFERLPEIGCLEWTKHEASAGARNRSNLAAGDDGRRQFHKARDQRRGRHAERFCNLPDQLDCRNALACFNLSEHRAADAGETRQSLERHALLVADLPQVGSNVRRCAGRRRATTGRCKFAL